MKATRLDAERARQFTQTGLWAGIMLDDYLVSAASRVPDDVAVIDRAGAHTYREIDRDVNRLAAAMAAGGVEHGDVVSWLLPNWAEAVVVHLAALRIGAVSNPIIPIYRHRETAFILRQARTKVVVVPNEFRGFDYPAMIEQICPEVPSLQTVVVVGADGGEGHGCVRFDALLAEGTDLPAAEVTREADDIALLLYTSGTTSAPKGALHSHNTLEHENRSIIDFFELTGNDVVFMPSPVGHITGVLYGIHLPFILGSTVVLLDVWEPGRALQLIEQHRCTFTVAATPFLHGLLHHPARSSHDTSSLRVFACGGAAVPPELIRQATETLECLVTRAYGSTEYPTATACSADDSVDKRARTDGRPIGHTKVRVVGDGELQVRGPELFLGYLDSSLNADAFTEDGWMRTGDLARIDDAGYVEITGRQKDIIIRGGENISAKEIEDALVEHPQIVDVAVVSAPDPILGERVCAVVVPGEGAIITMTGVIEFLMKRRMARQKLPESLLLLDELPRNASGKVQKFKLRNLVRETSTDDVPSTGR